MVAASGPGKALWHPMATVHYLDPRKNRLSKIAFPREGGRGGPRGGGAGVTADSPAPLLAL